MIPLERLQPRAVKVKLSLVNGRSVVVTLRPYTMNDHATLQREYTQEDHIALANAQLDAIAKISWYMLDNESKRLFSEYVEFQQYNEESGQDEVVKITGHEKLLHAIDGEESFWALLDGFAKCRGYNGFASDDEDVGVKKKKAMSKNPILIGAQYLKDWLMSTDTRPRKSLN